MQQVSERVVLAQKAYILFYIKNPPTNGHAAPAEPQSPRAAHHQPAQPPAAAQKPQQAPQSNGLNKLQPAPMKSQVDGKTSKASGVVYGPAERPETGLTAALQLRDELLAHPVDASAQQQQRSGRQSNAAFADGTAAQTSEQGTAQHQGIAAQRPASQSSMQQAAAAAAGMRSGAGHIPGQQAASHEAEDKRQVKQLAKRKAAELGSIKRPGMLQRMNPSGLEAAPDAADMPKRKKQATDKAAAASVEESMRSAARGDAPDSATESRQQQVGSAAVTSDDHAEDCVPSTSGRSDHAQPAPAADKAARYAVYKQPLQQ